MSRRLTARWLGRVAYDEAVWIHHRVFLGSEKDVDDIVDAISKIRGAVDELRTADHPLIRLKSMNRADRDRATSA